MAAAKRGRADGVAVLLAAGADVNVVDKVRLSVLFCVCATVICIYRMVCLL